MIVALMIFGVVGGTVSFWVAVFKARTANEAMAASAMVMFCAATIACCVF